MDDNIKISILSANDIWGDNRLGIFDEASKYENGENIIGDSLITSLAKLTGDVDSYYTNDSGLEIGNYWINYRWRYGDASLEGDLTLKYTEGDLVEYYSDMYSDNPVFVTDQYPCIRPVLKLSEKDFNEITKNKRKNSELPSVDEVIYGEYPQDEVSLDMQKELNEGFLYNRLVTTGRQYTIYVNNKLVSLPEYRYKDDDERRFVLLKGKKYEAYKWISVEPVKWFIDYKSYSLISKRCLLSGVSFCDYNYDGKFEDTSLYNFMNEYMLSDLRGMGKIDNKNFDFSFGIDDNINTFESLLDGDNSLSKDELELLKDALDKEKLENNGEKRYNSKPRS